MTDGRPPDRGVPGEISIGDDGAKNTALRRIPLTLTVKKQYDHFSDFIAEFGEHIYPEGMFVPMERPKPKGAQVRLDFRMRDGFQILLAMAEVVRSDQGLPGALSGMWISFRVLDPEQQALIQRIYSQRAASEEPSRPGGITVPTEASRGGGEGVEGASAAPPDGGDAKPPGDAGPASATDLQGKHGKEPAT